MAFFPSKALTSTLSFVILACISIALTRSQTFTNRPNPERIQRSAASLHARLEAVRKLAADGKLQQAEAAYRTLFDDPQFGRFLPLRLEFARLLDREGKHSEAMQQVRPLVFQRTRQSDLQAVEIYEADLQKLEGSKAVKAFRDEIRDRKLNGYSLRDYNQMGLNDAEAILFIKGSREEGKGDYRSAERTYRQILPDYPPSPEFFLHMQGVLGALHRQKEVIPLYEDWYRHSKPEMKAQIKKRFNLDFRRLDAEGLP